MDTILAATTIHQKRRALDKMANGLGLQDAYSTTLDRIKQLDGGRSKLGMDALMWVSHCERPLRSEELCHALGIELEAEDFTVDNVPLLQTVLGCTLGLVVIDEYASTVRLLHLTLQEYLGTSPTVFATPQSMMAEVCLTYLDSPSVRGRRSKALLASPFLEYATCFWGTHAAGEVTQQVKSWALRLLDGYVSAAVLWREKIRGRYFEGDVKGISGLHCIAFLGIAEIAVAMLGEKRWDVNGHDSWGQTPLMWAVRYRNYRVAELLLEQADIRPDVAIWGSRTLFSFAAESGDERAVRVLLEGGGVNPDSADSSGRTPLSFAVARGQEDVVRLLLEHEGVNPDSADSGGRTPLSFAIARGQEGVVRLLLERRGFNPNSTDGGGRTPLSFAIARGQEGVVRLLLEHGGVNPDSPNSNGRTPLSLAVLRGRQGIVKLLLERGNVNPNSSDKDGRTPLSLAVLRGYQGSEAAS